MGKICICGHTRGLHDYGFSHIPEGQTIQTTRTDVECRVNECGCLEYTPAEAADDSETGGV